jgi:hypothetical protein
MTSVTKPLSLALTLLALAIGAAPGRATATLINFNDQAAGRGGVFTGNVDSPLTIGIATFAGGELLNHEMNGVDHTGVYATISPKLVSGAYTNPLTISFSQTVSNFSLEVTNNLADSFTVADNVGDSQSMSLGNNSQAYFTLSGPGITSVTIGAANTTLWDFAIDNVRFTSSTVTPEPATWALIASAVPALAVYGWRRRREA